MKVHYRIRPQTITEEIIAAVQSSDEQDRKIDFITLTWAEASDFYGNNPFLFGHIIWREFMALGRAEYIGVTLVWPRLG